MNAVSILCLSLVGVLCAIGVFHHRYDDTLGERVGMSLVGLWALARVGARLTADFDTEPVHLMLHVGLASFASGMAWAKWCAHRPAQRSAA